MFINNLIVGIEKSIEKLTIQKFSTLIHFSQNLSNSKPNSKKISISTLFGISVHKCTE